MPSKKSLDTFLNGGGIRRPLTHDKIQIGDVEASVIHIGFRYGRKIFLSRFITHNDSNDSNDSKFNNHYLENFKYYDILRFNFRHIAQNIIPLNPLEYTIYLVDDDKKK
jgi:hypothetical protein